MDKKILPSRVCMYTNNFSKFSCHDPSHWEVEVLSHFPVGVCPVSSIPGPDGTVIVSLAFRLQPRGEQKPPLAGVSVHPEERLGTPNPKLVLEPLHWRYVWHLRPFLSPSALWGSSVLETKSFCWHWRNHILKQRYFH